MSELPKMRTIQQTVAHFREHDPHSAITETALRRLTATGELVSVRVGAKYLLDLERVSDYFRRGNAITPTQCAAKR